MSLSAMIVVHGFVVISRMEYANFSLQNEMTHLLYLLTLGLSLLTLWSKEATARFKDKKQVRKLRILISILILVFLIMDLRLTSFQNPMLDVLSVSNFSLIFFLFIIINLWTKSLDELVLKD